EQGGEQFHTPQSVSYLLCDADRHLPQGVQAVGALNLLLPACQARHIFDDDDRSHTLPRGPLQGNGREAQMEGPLILEDHLLESTSASKRWSEADGRGKTGGDKAVD